VGKGAAQTAQNAESSTLANSNSLVQLAQQQAGNSAQLFQTAMPGYAAATDFYTALSTGDPYAIARATAPANQQITAASTGAKQNILNNAPAGGEKNLALENVDVSQGAQVGKTASEGYLNSFNALASLSGQGMGASQGAARLATSQYGAANQGFGQVGSEALQQKGQTMGAISAGVGDAAAVAGSFFTGGASLAAAPSLHGGGGKGGGSSPQLDPGYTMSPTGPVANASVLPNFTSDAPPPVNYGGMSGMGGGFDLSTLFQQGE
jgi:hypothetical protein